MDNAKSAEPKSKSAGEDRRRPGRHVILTLSCDDRPGIVAAVAGNYRAVEVLVKRGALLESVTMPQGWRALGCGASHGISRPLLLGPGEVD